MRNSRLIAVLAAATAVFGGCSGDGGSGGGSGTGGTAGTGGGSNVALSFDETTSIPATAASAAVMDAATRFATTVSAILELASADAALAGASPKVLVPGFCASGQADLVLPPGPPTGWSQGDQIVLTLTTCEGSVLSSSAVSGSVSIDIETVMIAAPDIRLDVLADVGVTGGATIEGTFAAVAFVGIGGVSVQLGKQLDDDDLSISDGSVDLALGCFDILVSLASNKSIVPLAVAKLGNQVYTVNDYAASPPGVILDDTGVPSAGTLTMTSRDNSAASPERTGPCPGFEVVEDGSRITAITATFSEGGCIELTGAVTQSTSWDKLLAGDLSPGGGPGCGGAIPITCEERSGNIMELPDSTFNDADWEVAFVSQTAGSTVDQQAVQQATGGVSDSSFRQMTHVIDQTTGCADERCSIVVYHRSSLTYDPGTEGAIAFIDYTETHRIIEAAFAGAAVGWTFYAEQDNTRYVASGERTAFTTTEWSTDSICGITPEDFTAEGLDFSTSGGPITFGFTRSNTNTSTINVQRNVHGIDDFKVVVVKEPPQQ